MGCLVVIIAIALALNGYVGSAIIILLVALLASGNVKVKVS